MCSVLRRQAFLSLSACFRAARSARRALIRTASSSRFVLRHHANRIALHPHIASHLPKRVLLGPLPAAKSASGSASSLCWSPSPSPGCSSNTSSSAEPHHRHQSRRTLAVSRPARRPNYDSRQGRTTPASTRHPSLSGRTAALRRLVLQAPAPVIEQADQANEVDQRPARPMVVLYGQDEQQTGEVNARDMESGDQHRVPLAEIGPFLAAHLNGS